MTAGVLGSSRATCKGIGNRPGWVETTARTGELPMRAEDTAFCYCWQRGERARSAASPSTTRRWSRFADLDGDVEDQLIDACHVLVADVLRLVGHLMVVRVATGGEEDDRNVVPGVVRVVAAAVDVLRMPIGIHAVVELERHLFGLVYRFGDVAELGRQAARRRPAARSPAIAVQLDAVLALRPSRRSPHHGRPCRC